MEQTTQQLIKQIAKTDKVIADFLSNCNYLVEYVDQTNSSELHQIKQEIQDFLDRRDVD